MLSLLRCQPQLLSSTAASLLSPDLPGLSQTPCFCRRDTAGPATVAQVAAEHAQEPERPCQSCLGAGTAGCFPPQSWRCCRGSRYLTLQQWPDAQLPQKLS